MTKVHKRRSEFGERPTAVPQSLRSCAAEKEDVGLIPAATSIFFWGRRKIKTVVSLFLRTAQTPGGLIQSAALFYSRAYSPGTGVVSKI